MQEEDGDFVNRFLKMFQMQMTLLRNWYEEVNAVNDFDNLTLLN